MKQLRIVLGFLISALFLFLAFRGVHLGDVAAELGRANYLWLFPAVAAIVASIWLRAVRWRLLFHPHDDLRLRSVFGAFNVGYLVNDVMPLRLGEIVRAYLLTQTERVRMAHALSTVAVERVTDMVVTLTYLAVVLPFVSLPAGAGPKVAVVALIAVGALVAMLIAGAVRERTHAVVRVVTGRLPERHGARIHGLMDAFLHGFAVLSIPQIALPVLALSLAIWALAALGLYCVLFAFGLNLSPAAPVLVLALVSISFVLPASPGYVGVFHYAVVAALEMFNVDENVARSYALIAHLVAFVPPMILGAAYLWRAGISWERVFAFRRPPVDSGRAPKTDAVTSMARAERDPAGVVD